MKVFAQLSKVDVEKRLVYGRAAQETPDHSGEVMDYAQSKPNFVKWSAEMSKATGGASQGNIRAMHGNVAAGKVQELIYNDDEHAIDVVAKIVDDNEWSKVLEGVYTGFSIGGKYGARVTKGAFKHYEAIPSEISLVDRPCIPTATFFDIQKADGTVMQKSFQIKGETTMPTEIEYQVEGTPEQADALAKLLAENKLSIGDAVAAVEKALIKSVDAMVAVDLAVAGYDKAILCKMNGDEIIALDTLEKLAPFADPANNKYPIDNPAQIKAAWTYINMEKNSGKYTAEDLLDVKKAISDAWIEKIDKAGPPAVEKAAKIKDLKKGMSAVSMLGDMLQSLYYLACQAVRESASEGDDSPIPARLKQVVLDIAGIYKDMAREEADELLEDLYSNDEPVPEVMQMAYGVANDLIKFGARNSASDKDMLQKMHDLTSKLGATCATMDEPKQTDAGAGLDTKDSAQSTNIQMAQAEQAGDLIKVSTSQEAITKLVADAMLPLNKALSDAMEKIAKLEAQPLPAKGVLRVVGKENDSATEVKKVEIAPVVGQDGKINEAATMFKSIHSHGGAPLIGGFRNTN
jgi:hypothetical protein